MHSGFNQLRGILKLHSHPELGHGGQSHGADHGQQHRTHRSSLCRDSGVSLKRVIHGYIRYSHNGSNGGHHGHAERRLDDNFPLAYLRGNCLPMLHLEYFIGAVDHLEH